MLPSSVSNRQPQEPGESWEVGIGVTLTPKRRVGQSMAIRRASMSVNR